MRKAWPLAAALVFAFVSYAYQAVQVPGRVMACSCMAPLPTLAEVARDEGTSIVVASVGRALPDRTPISVEGWFVGGPQDEVVWLSGGSQMMTSCDMFMTAGERRLLVLSRADQGLFSTNPCAPTGLLGTADGDALLATAIDLFGDPNVPQAPASTSPEPEPEPESVSPVATEPSAGLSPGVVWVAAAVGVGVLFFGAIVLFARRRPTN